MIAAYVASAFAATIAAVFSARLARQYAARRRPHALAWSLSLGLFAVAAASVVVGLAAGWSAGVYAVFWLTGALVTVPFLAAGQLMLLDPRRAVLYGTLAGLAVVWSLAALALSPLDPAPLRAASEAGSIPRGEAAWGDSLAYRLLSPFNYTAVIVVVGTIWSAVRSRRFRILGIAVGVVVAGSSFAFVRTGRVDLFALALAAGVALMYGGFVAAGKPPRRTHEARGVRGAGRGMEPATHDSGRRPRVTVYTRDRCGLCRQAEAVVEQVARGRADVELVDIDGQEKLRERYTVRVPVVAVDGQEVAQYQIAPEELDAALRAAERSGSPA